MTVALPDEMMKKLIRKETEHILAGGVVAAQSVPEWNSDVIRGRAFAVLTKDAGRQQAIKEFR